MDPADVKRWMTGRKLAAAREREELRDRPPSPEESIRRGFRLIRLKGQLLGWPVPQREEDRRRDLEVYERWARLRRALTEAP